MEDLRGVLKEEMHSKVSLKRGRQGKYTSNGLRIMSAFLHTIQPYKMSWPSN